MDDPKLSRMSGSRVCGCKGIRSCRLCMATDAQEVFIVSRQAPRKIFNYCIHCSKAWQEETTSKQEKCDETSTSQSPENAAALDKPGNCEIKAADLNDDASNDDPRGVKRFPEKLQQSNISVHLEASPSLGRVRTDAALSCSHNASSEGEPPVESFLEESQQLNTSTHPEAAPRLDGVNRDVSSCSHNANRKIDFEGIVILEEFVSEAEEADLDTAIADTNFVNSQSGRRKQDFGPKVNFKKQKVRTANFTGLPSYSQFLYQRMKAHPHLSDFEPVELCNLEYCQCRGAHIDPHFDDDWLWGERLVTLNLLSDSVLTFTLDSAPDVVVRVPLRRRSLIVVAAAARYSWKHSILPGDIVGRRVAMTFRELSKEFRSGGSRDQQGVELLKLALTFSGLAVGR